MFRFRRRLRLLPGLNLNFSKNGLSSLSLGGRGATVNVPLARSGPAQGTASLPGTGISYSEPLGQRPSTRERRQRQRPQQPTTQQLVDMLQEAVVGPDSIGNTLWQQHGIGLVGLLQQRADTPRSVLEQIALVGTWDRMELHVRRGHGPADTLARTKQVLAAIETVLAYARSIGVLD